MTRRSICAMLIPMALLGGCTTVQKSLPSAPNKPRLLASLPAEWNTPDAVRLHAATGDFILSCPNFNDTKYPAKILRITPGNKVELFCDFPKHPQTGKGGPMGLDFGPDGHLYVADNQYFWDKDHKSRLIRIRMGPDGKPGAAEVVVEGFKLANAVQWRGDAVFVSDTFFDLKDKPGASGVYRITLAEMDRGLVKLKPKGQADPHLVLECRTDPTLLPYRKGDVSGADGITFDAEGNLYTGNYGDGTMYKVSFNADGSVKSSGVFLRSPRLTCVDGLFYDAKRKVIYVADSEKNAVQVVTLDGKISTLWANGDTDGRDGLLDQPCEVAVRSTPAGDELIVVSIDVPFPGLVNTKYDPPNTISVIKLK